MPSSREDVGQSDEVCFVFLASGQFEGVEVGKGDTEILSLTTSIGPHRHVAIGAASEARIDAQTEARVAFFTVSTATVGYIEGQDDSITFLEQSDPTTELLDYAHILVACPQNSSIREREWFWAGEYMAWMCTVLGRQLLTESDARFCTRSSFILETRSTLSAKAEIDRWLFPTI